MEADDYMDRTSSSAAENFIFLSREWITSAVLEIERAKANNEELRKRLSGVNFRLAFRVIDIPPKLRELYGSDQVVAYFKIDNGDLKDFFLTNKAPKDIDFTITAEYTVAKEILEGKVDPLTAFTNFMVRVRPFRRLFSNPLSSAKLLSIANDLLKLVKNVPTIFSG
jgi:putative sterol carrier protein